MDTKSLVADCAALWEEMRAHNPLVHCITNYVTINDVANSLIAAGASPAMVEHPEEVAEFTPLASALYINLGVMNNAQEKGMIAAAQAARQHNIPGLVDPVACGVISKRLQLSWDLFKVGFLKIMKGNGAEIKSLAGLAGKAKGVDSLDEGEGLEQACWDLSTREKITVVATGKVDVVAGSTGIAKVNNGTSLFQQITGAGCMVGGIIAAFLGTSSQPWLASITGLLGFNIAGELAAQKAGDRPATFKIALMDQLSQLTKEEILKEAKVEWHQMQG